MRYPTVHEHARLGFRYTDHTQILSIHLVYKGVSDNLFSDNFVDGRVFDSDGGVADGLGEGPQLVEGQVVVGGEVGVGVWARALVAARGVGRAALAEGARGRRGGRGLARLLAQVRVHARVLRQGTRDLVRLGVAVALAFWSRGEEVFANLELIGVMLILTTVFSFDK